MTFTTLNLQELEYLAILKALELTYGNKTRAAKLLGVGTATLYRKLNRYGIIRKCLINEELVEGTGP